MAKKTHYAIRVGRESNVIVRTWAECKRLVTGYSGAVFKGFTSEAQDKLFLGGRCHDLVKKPAQREMSDYRKERHYMEDGIRFADYGTTYTSNHIDTADMSVPW